MNPRDREVDRILDKALTEIRDERPDAKFAASAADQVWQQIADAGSEQSENRGPKCIESCADFQGLIPSYLDGKLDRNPMLLLKDHLGECVPCRRAHKQLRAQRTAVTRTVEPQSSRSSWVATVGWRVAAAAVIFVALVGVSVKTDVFTFETGGLIKIEAVEGELFRVSEEGSVPLQAGQQLTLEEGESIRTAKNSSAVLAMADASQIEMRERSELAVLEKRSFIPGRRSDGVIDLERGSVIVEASDQGSGHLHVKTNECDVAVQGTVFAVNHGIKGSRVSVIEGEVHVDHSGDTDVLLAGQQTTTRRALGRVPVEQEIAWSQNSERYVELLREIRALADDIDAAFKPGLRYSTDLLDLAPANTVVFFSMPNVSEELSQAYEILQARMAGNAILSQWWDEQMGTDGHAAEFEQVLNKIAAYGDPLGEEIVMTVQVGGEGTTQGPLFLAKLDDASGFKSLLEQELAELDGTSAEGSAYILEGELALAPPASSGNEGEVVFFWITDGLLALATDFAQLQALNAVLQGLPGASLAGDSFHDALTERYLRGVEWAVGVDLQALILADNPSDLDTLESIGLLDVEHVIGERRQLDGRTENRVVATFDQPRRKLAAWLAEPAPIGALDYVSPDASMVATFAMKDMDTLVAELFEFIGAADSNFVERLEEFEQEHGVDILRDFAAPLGGEFTMALDGPVLPKPSWKLIVEVYDPARLRQTLTWLVEQLNLEFAGTEYQGLSLDEEHIGGRYYYRLESLDTGLEVHYVFDAGYVVFAPSRALLERALQARATGIQLTDSPDFVELLPTDGEVNFSGALYHNLGSVLGPLSRTLAGSGMGNLGPEQARLIEQITKESKPALALLYGEEDRIVFTSTSEGGLFSSGLSSITGFGGLLGMQQSLIESLQEQVGSHDGTEHSSTE
jgi:hypothetical protein